MSSCLWPSIYIPFSCFPYYCHPNLPSQRFAMCSEIKGLSMPACLNRSCILGLAMTSDATVQFSSVQRALCLNSELTHRFSSEEFLNPELNLEEPVQLVRFRYFQVQTLNRTLKPHMECI